MSIAGTQNETIVNTTGPAGGDIPRPQIAQITNAAGVVTGTVAVWVTNNAVGGSDWDIVMQRYDLAGAKVGTQTIVNTNVAGRQSEPYVATLAGGLFVVGWEGGDGIGRGTFVQAYQADGTAIGGELRVSDASSANQYGARVAAMNGGFVVSMTSDNADGSGNAITAQRVAITGSAGSYGVALVTQAGGALAAGSYDNFLVNQATTGNQWYDKVVSLAGGGVLALYSSPDTNQSGVFGRVMAANGTLGAQFQISSEAGSHQIWSDAVQLANGNLFVTWASEGQDGSGYGIYARILTAAGVPVTDEFRINDFTVGNQGFSNYSDGPKVALLGDGSVIVTFLTDSGEQTEVYGRRFKADGSPDGASVLLNQTTQFYQSTNDVVATPNGFRAIWMSDAGHFGSYDTVQRDFAVAGTIPTTQPIVRTGGEDQVNTGAQYRQENAQVAARADGSYVVVWASQTAQGAGDGSGWGLFAQRYDKNGIAQGGEFQVNQAATGDQYHYSTTTLTGGRFVVTWHSGGDGGGADTYFRVFNADGTAATGDLRANANAGYDAFPSVTALSTGGFLVAWNTNFYNGGASQDPYFQRYDANGVAVGGEVRVSDVGGVNAGDGDEAAPKMVGLNDGKFVVVYEDRSGEDGSSVGLYARVFDAAGAAGAIFQINQYTTDAQRNASVAKLSNGGFVVVWTSNGQDTSAEGVYARVFNASGVAQGDEFRVNANAQYSQYAPQVAVLADGSFVVTWSSDHDDGFSGTDVYAARFSATGAQLNQEFRVNGQVTQGTQRFSDIAATENGFVITFVDDDNGNGRPDGDASGIFRQEFTIDGLNAAASGERAERPSIAFGGSTANLIVNPGAELGSSAGDYTAVFTPQGWTAVSGNFTAVQYGITPNDGVDANDAALIGGGSDYFAGGPNNASSAIRQTIDVSGQATTIDTGRVAARLSGFFGGWNGDSDNIVMQVRYLSASGAELAASSIGGVGPVERGYVPGLLYREDADIVPVGTRSIEVTLVSTRFNGVYNDGFADNLSLVLSPFGIGAEDSAIAIPLTIATQDANTATPETLRIEIGNIPVGATLSDGVRQFTATRFADAVDITGWNRGALTITPPLNQETDFRLEVRATATEPATGDTATTVRELLVDVIARPETLVRGEVETRVNSYTDNQQTGAEIASSPTGSGSVIVWHSLYQDGSGWGVYMQRYSDAGVPLGEEVRVNVGTVGDQYNAKVAYLADGRFVVVWQQGSDAIVQRVFNADGTPAGGDQQVGKLPDTYGFNNATVTALAGGGWITSWYNYGYVATPDLSENGVYAQRYNAAGQAVSRDGATVGADIFLLNTTTASYQDEQAIAATADGGFVAIWSSYNQGGDAIDGVIGQRFDASGAKVGGEFAINQLTDGTQNDPQVKVLSNGNFIVTWQTDTTLDGDNSGYGLSGRLYNASGVALTGEFTINTFTGNTQSVASVTALPGGGFAIAWQSDGRQTSHDIVVQVFDAEGDKVGAEQVVSSPVGSTDYAPSIVYDGTGLSLAWTADAVDGSTNAVVARRIALPGLAIEPTGGVRVVPATTAYSQQDGDVTTLADGSYVVVWQTQPVAGTGDNSSWSVRAQHYEANGARRGGEFTVNTNVAYDQSKPSITALDGGDYLVVWHSQTGDGSGYGIYAQRYNADDSKDGAEFRINDAVGGNQLNPRVTALHGDQAGGFAVTWQLDDNIYARAFGADNQAIGSDIRVDRPTDRVGGGDAQENTSRIAAGASGGFTIVWQDNFGDGNFWSVIGQRFAISGGAVSALGGVSADGSAAPGNFSVNATYYGSQFQPDIAALADGGTVVVWYSDFNGEAMAQIYNADGTRRGGEINLSNRPGAQSEPSVTALADGSFVVVWRDDADGQFSDVTGGRYSATGTLIDSFTVNADAYYQYQPRVVAQGDGFNVVFTAQSGADGFGPFQNSDGNGIFIQHMTVDYGPGAKTAQRPVLTLDGIATGAEDSAIALDVRAALANTDGGSETLRLVIEDVPVGARITDGTRTFTSTLQNPALDLTGWTLANLRITPPADYNGTFTLDLRATAREATGDVAFNTGTIKVVVTPVDEVLPEYGAEQRDNVFTGNAQWQPAVASQADGSYLVVWRSEGQPGQPSPTTMAQLHAADGSKVGTEFSVNLTNNYNYDPRVVALSDGTYLVGFTSGDGDSNGVFAQRVSASGQLLAIDGGTGTPAAVRLNTFTSSDQQGVDLVALKDGGWVATWVSFGNDGSGYGIAAQRFAANGAKVGEEIVVNTVTAGNVGWPEVAQLTDGSIAYTWNNTTGIVARIFRTDGTSTGEIALGAGDLATIEALPGGGFVVAWRANDDIVAQRLDADGDLQGASFRVNSYAWGQQWEPQIAAMPDGGFTIGWNSNGQDGSSWGVYGQRYDALGAAVGTEYRVNRAIPGDQSTPALVAQGDGSGLIWTFEGQDGSSPGSSVGTYTVRLPITDATAPQAIEFAQGEQQVNDPAAAVAGNGQNDSSITTLADGSYVVTYNSFAQDGSSWSVVARHYEADGDPIEWAGGGLEKVLNLTTAGEQLEATVAAFSEADGGGFVVVYRSSHDAQGAFARRFDATGAEVQLKDASGIAVGELRISAPNGTGYDPEVKVGADGGFVVVFTSDRIGQSRDVYLRAVDSDGQLVGTGDTLLAQNTAGEQGRVQLTALAGGGYVAVWHSADHDGSSYGIYGRVLGANGQPTSAEFLINTLTDSEQSWPTVAATTNGGFVVAWNTATGYDSDDSSYGIAAQRFTVAGGQAVRAGGEFVVNGIAQHAQIHPMALATQDGGFVIAWESDVADNSGYAIAGRRFDASGNPTEPYGNDFIINTTAPGDQNQIAMALLDRGFVTTWTSSEANGTIRMQRFEGAGLEPPPYVVDPATGNDTTIDRVYATIQEALDAAPEGQTILIRGGTYVEALTVTTDNLKLVNAAGESVIVRAPSGAVALTVAKNVDLTIGGDAASRFTFQGAAGQAAMLFLGLNSGSEIGKTTIASGANGSGLVFRGGQDGVSVTDNAFTGANNLTIQGANAALGLGGSSNMIVLRNAFATSGGYAIDSAATLGRIVQNVFDGQAGLTAASVQLRAAGVDFTFNRFQAGVGPHFRDLGSTYDEGAVIAGNSFPEGWVRGAAANVLYATITQAMGAAAAGETVTISGGAWDEGVVTVAANDLKVSAPAGLTPATGIALQLGEGVAKITLLDGADIAVTGNGLANTIIGNAGGNVLAGGDGDDSITGGAGVDTLDGGANDDTLTVQLGSDGADLIEGGEGEDIAALITAGSLVLTGDATTVTAADTGGTARATLTGVETVSVILSGGDRLTVGAMAGQQDVVVSGSTSNNVVTTTASTTAVYFDGGAGDDTFIGGGARDGILYASATTAVLVNLGSAAFTVGAATVAAGTARDQFGNTDTLSGIDYVQTGSGNDRVDGGALGETILTGLGNDTVNGGGGDDLIFAGLGTNILAGGAGNDTYYIESATDTITEAAGAANGIEDKVVTALGAFSIANFANVEQIVADSDAAHTFTGNTGANKLVGAKGNDTLNGGGGADVLVGGLGTNTLNGGADIDTVDYSAVTGPVVASLAANTGTATGITDTFVSIEALIGGAQGDTFTGGDLADRLDGGEGDDTLRGGLGADVLIGGGGSDTAIYAGGPATGMLVRTGANAWTLASGADGTDTLQTVEMIRFLGADAASAADDRLFQVVNGNVAVQVAADTGTATEAGGVANGTAAVAATGNVLSNDVNLDESAAAGDVMKVASAGWTGATGPGTGSGAATTNVAASGTTAIAGRYGTLTIAANGAYTYTPDAAKSDLLADGQVATETFTYTAGDGIGAGVATTLTITLTGRNDAPVAVANAGTTNENAALAVNVIANDTDVDLGATRTLVSASVPTGKGSVAVSGGNVVFTPGTAFDRLAVGTSETVAVSYVIRDDKGATATGTLTITVNGTNDGPVAVADSVTTGENSAITIDSLANDTDVDDGAVKSLVSVAAPAGKGSATIANGRIVFDPGTAFDRLAAGASEVVTLTYVMRDQAGATSTSTIAVTVTGTNDAPVAVADTGATTENAAVTVDVLGNDTDVDDGATRTLVSASVPAGKGSVAVAGGNVTFTPGTDFDRLAAGATETVAVSYVIRDDRGAETTGTLTITVTGTNDAPVAVADAVTTDENTAILIDALANDTDADAGATRTLVSVTAPDGKGTAVLSAGKVRYTPGTAFDHLAAGASEVVTLTYVMRDDKNVRSTGTVTVTVTGTNDAPVAVADVGATTSKEAVTVDVLANDTDVDDGATRTLVSATAPAGKGSVSVSGNSVVFAPGSDFNRLAAGATETVAIRYVVRDDKGGEATGTLTITVTGTNDAPVAVADSATVEENRASTIDVLANDTDDGGTLTLVSASAPAGKGTVTITDNKVRFVTGTAFDYLAVGKTETVTISYVVSDEQGAQATGTLRLTVTGANDRPIVTADTATVEENRAVTFSPLANDRDPDTGDVLTVTNAVVVDGRGTVTIANNRIQFVTGRDFDRLAPGQTDTVRITYDITDSSGATTASAATVTVTGVNDRPLVKPDKITGREDKSLTINAIDLLENDRDPDRGQTLTVTSVQDAKNGTVSLADGVITFTPTAEFGGVASFAYTVSDGAGGTATSTVKVLVRGVNDPAVARDDAFTIGEDAVLRGNVFADNGSGVDFDIDSASFRVGLINGDTAIVGRPATLISGAILTLHDDGTFRYDTNGAFDHLTGVSGATNSSATDSFTYNLVGGGSATVTIAVQGRSDSVAPALGTDGADTMIGTNAAETIVGGLGADRITPGGGADILVYAGAADSPGTGFDVVTGFAFDADRFDVAGVRGDYHRDADVTGAKLSAATLNGDLRTALSGILTDHGASLVTATSGDLAGRTFLVIDQNGRLGYQGGADLVIELVSPTAVPATGVDFLM